MEFCKKCNGIMRFEEYKLKCIHCGNSQDGDIISKQKIKKPIERGSGIIESDKNIFADYEHECESCGYKKAQIIMRGPFISDEDDVVMLKCGKCGKSIHLERKSM